MSDHDYVWRMHLRCCQMKTCPSSPNGPLQTLGMIVNTVLPIKSTSSPTVDPLEHHVIMTLSFTKQQDISIHDITYKVSQQLHNIVEHMVYNEVQ